MQTFFLPIYDNLVLSYNITVLTKPNRMKILIIRNDKLGDFVLTLPCYAMLKQNYPDAEITVLVPEYTAEIARCCPSIDKVIIDDGRSSLSSLLHMIRSLRKCHFDSVITLYSTTRIGMAVFLAGIRHRLAPATKMAQIFYNYRLKQRRSKSEKPEYEYNLDMVKQYLLDAGIREIAVVQPPYLSFDNAIVEEAHQDFCSQHQIDISKKLVFLHAGSGGSANNLNLEQYAQLVMSLDVSNEYLFVLTAGPGELERVRALSGMLVNIPHVIYNSTEGLVTFAQHIAFAHLFISGSTGTLHIAGALDIPTAAFYTRRQSATSLRWQTLNSPERRLAFMPPDYAEAEDMSKVNVPEAAKEITEKFLTG